MAFFFFLHGSICAIWTQVDSCSDVNVEDCSVCVCVCSPYFNSSLSPVYKSYVFAFASSSDSRSRSGHINNAAKAGLCFIRQTVAVLFHHLQHVNNVSLFVFFFISVGDSTPGLHRRTPAAFHISHCAFGVWLWAKKTSCSSHAIYQRKVCSFFCFFLWGSVYD